MNTSIKLGRTAKKEAAVSKPLSPTRLAWVRFTRNKVAVFGAIVVIAFVIIGVFAKFIAPYPYDKTNLYQALAAPGVFPEHVLGTDDIGRDFLSRLIYGAQTSLIVGVTIQFAILVLGFALGFLSGWYGGAIDFVISRIIEITTSLPGLFFQMILITLLGGPGVFSVIVAIALLSWPGLTRLVRAQILDYKNREFLNAARALGAGTAHLAWHHMVPNILNPIIISVTFSFPGLMLAEAGLSFLGYGINDPIPSWGKMMGQARAYIQSFWHLGILPTALLAFVILGFSFFGDGVRDALDPRGDRS